MADDADDPIHNHPTVQGLIRGHNILFIVAVVLGLACIGFAALSAYDHTFRYSRPAMLN